MATWTSDQILALAPDPASAKAGQGLASAGKWVSLGADERAVWGEAKGSAAVPYQTVIDLSEPAFRCSCPSRKFPCKHALGLFLLFGQGACAAGPAPEWATDWLAKREAKASASKAPSPSKEIDPQAQAKRAAKRDERVAVGLEECERWLRDVVRTGLSSATLQSPRYWDEMAAQMVDAQAPGVARLVRDIGGLVASGQGWESKALDRLGSLYLLTQAYGRLDTLPIASQADVRAAVGFTVRREEIAEADALEDFWTVLGQRTWTEDRLRVQRTWLMGAQSRRWAMVLAFSVAGQPFDPLLVTGTAFFGRVAFYPSAFPLRATVLDRLDAPPAPFPNGTIAEGLERFADVLSHHPWQESLSIPIKSARLAVADGDWDVVDGDGTRLRLAPGFTGWRVLAQTGGAPFPFLGEWDGREMYPLSFSIGGRVVAL